MQELIKFIRKNAGLKQEEFAKAIGSTSVTVNRWENGKALPNLMAQQQIYYFAKTVNIDLCDYIINSIKPPESKNITLYHGSREGIQGNITPSSRSRCDFGKGFYMGTDPLQPLTLICNEERPIIYSLNLNTKGLKILEIDVGIEWAMLIAFYRGYMDEAKGTELYNKYAHLADNYDVIVGYIANDRMYQVLTDFFEKRITDTALIGCLSALKLGKQYVAISKKACKKITVLSEHHLSKLELLCLKDKSIERRNKGISMAEEIVLKHRRDGLFFDEILRGEKYE